MSINTEKTKFRIFLQPPYVPGFEQPVTVEIETESKIEAGPKDKLLYVLDAENKPRYRAEAPHEYQPYRGRPWRGDANRVIARPNYDGHFDHLTPDDPSFPAASIYATARLVLNFWNRIFSATNKSKIDTWHHQPENLALEGEDEELAYRLQLVPRCVSAGSRSGYGYVEVGRDNPGHAYTRYSPYDGAVRVTYQKGPMWQNFDVIAHEMGHAILFKVIGFPKSADQVTEWFKIDEPEFLAFHESMADLCAILSLLDVSEARDFFLTQRSGIDVVAGIGELQKLDQTGFLPIRSAKNSDRYPGSGKFKAEEAHQNSMSLTGAVFDALLSVYEQLRGSSPLPEAKQALAGARDVVAKSLAELWTKPSAMWQSEKDRRGFSFVTVAKALVELIEDELKKEDKNFPRAAFVKGTIAEQFERHNLYAARSGTDVAPSALTAQVPPGIGPLPATRV